MPTTSGTEQQRQVSTSIPAAGTLLISSDEPAVYVGDGATLPGDLRRPGETPQPAPIAAAISRATTTGIFKVMLLGTSKQTFDRSACQVFSQHLKAVYGDSGAQQWRIGNLGSLNAYQGWQSQRYSGPFQYRLVGLPTSTVFQLPFYGDKALVEFSQETDSEAVAISIDGVQVGSTPGPGPQAYSLTQTFTVTEGAHVLSVALPTTGKVYWEWMEGGLAARTGVEVRDATLGGSLLGNLTTTPAADPGMAASIPVVGDNGINAHFNRPDIDLYVMGYIVNDAGANATNQAQFLNVWKPIMDKAAALTAANGAKLVLIIETAGHYVMPNDGGNTNSHRQYMLMADYYRRLARKWNHITVVDHHAATAPASYSQTDIAAYAARYFPSAGTVNAAAGTYTGTDFIHEDAAIGGPSNWIGTQLLCQAAGVSLPKKQLGTLVQADQFRTPASPKVTLDQLVTIAGTTKRINGHGVALQTYAPGTTSLLQGRVVPYFRDANPTNLAAATQTAIDTTPTGTDPTYGPYLTMNLYNVGLGSTIDWAGGQKRMLTVRGRGTLGIRVGGVTKLYTPKGTVIPVTDTVNDRTLIRYVVPDAEPVTIAVTVGASATNGTVSLSGDIFEVALVDANVPTLVKNAPPITQGAPGAPGATGPAGGITSAVQSGRWSLPTSFGTVTTLALPSASRGFALPFVPAQSGTITALACEVTTAAAGCLARLGIYDAGSDGYPTNLLYGSEQIDLGASVGFKQTAAFSQAVTGGHLYWLVLVAQGTALSTVRGLNSFNPLLTVDTANLSSAASWRFTATDVLAATFPTSKIVDGSAPLLRALFA